MADQQGEQSARSLCDQLQITTEELRARLAFLSFGEQDRRNLVEIRDVISSGVEELIGGFYDHLLQFEELRGILSDSTARGATQGVAAPVLAQPWATRR